MGLTAPEEGNILESIDMDDIVNTPVDVSSGFNENRESAEGLGLRIRYRRKKRVWTLDQLADASGVSRAGISRIERGETVPSTTTLSRIAEALGLSFSELMSVQSNEEGEVVLLEPCQQPVFTDENGFERRCIAPVLPSKGLDWVHNKLPAGATSGTLFAHTTAVEEYLYVLDGKLEVRLGESVHELKAGDSLYYRAQLPRQFTAIGKRPCQYMMVINAPR